jgi:hypothetical protein
MAEYAKIYLIFLKKRVKISSVELTIEDRPCVKGPVELYKRNKGKFNPGERLKGHEQFAVIILHIDILPETFCRGDVLLEDVLLQGDVLLQRRFDRRRFVEETFCKEAFCMCVEL